jgi:protein-disulfide isomerase
MASLTSAAVPDVGADDHVWGTGPQAILYLDLACQHCAAAWPRLSGFPISLVFRHFPVSSKHPGSPALHAAVEAVALQRDEAAARHFVDSIYRDQAHVDDPHLWERAREHELDLDRFDRDRRSAAATERVRRDFEGGIRAGVTGTPAVFVEGQAAEVEDLGPLAL